MKIVTLLENTACGELASEHGLSLYIETKKHKILFDSGASDAFLHNAKALGVDLSKVDIAFLSHAHNDHCGGLAHFCALNQSAKVYMQREAFGEYYVVTPTRQVFIGLSEEVKAYENRFVFCEGTVKIDEELSVFSGVEARELVSGANATLREKAGGPSRATVSCTSRICSLPKTAKRRSLPAAPTRASSISWSVQRPSRRASTRCSPASISTIPR